MNKNEMIMDFVFPKPVGFVKLDNELSDQIFNFCDKNKNEIIRNTGNESSQDKYILEHPEFVDLKSFLEEKANEYFNKIFTPPEDLSLVITQSWLNYTSKGQFHHTHRHANSFVSGVFYIDTDDNDKINFYEEIWAPYSIPSQNYGCYNSPLRWFPTEKNSLVLFPSNLKHGVEEIIDDHTRISLAFNTFFNGTIGKYEDATELKL